MVHIDNRSVLPLDRGMAQCRFLWKSHTYDKINDENCSVFPFGTRQTSGAKAIKCLLKFYCCTQMLLLLLYFVLSLFHYRNNKLQNLVRKKTIRDVKFFDFFYVVLSTDQKSFWTSTIRKINDKKGEMTKIFPTKIILTFKCNCHPNKINMY